MNEPNKDKNDDIHTMPDDGLHKCSINCFCNPKLYYEDEITGRRCFLHKSKEEMNQ